MEEKNKKPRKKPSKKGEETILYRTWKVSINKMKYLYLVTHYLVTPRGENLFDDVQAETNDKPGFDLKKLYIEALKVTKESWFDTYVS